MSSYLCVSKSHDAWLNLASDEQLLNTAKAGDIWLFLYVNENAVILGQNQNPWAECDLDAMRADGVQLVRRCSGGGAVYHDLGNLNYSFICPKSVYDEEKQTALVLDALKALGISAEKSGRNDLCAGGRKISGTAYCSRGENRQQHGTLLIDSDLDRLGRYLTVAPQKLESKGVKSVRSRVANLSELVPGLTVTAVTQALKEAFEREYGGCTEVQPPVCAELYERNKSWAWQLGRAPEFDCRLERRFDWGMAELCLNVKEGRISGVKLYTDALDTELSKRVEGDLLGRRFDKAELESLDFLA